MQRSDLELELAKARADIAYYGSEIAIYEVDPNSLIYHFGITEIDGVPVRAKSELLFDAWD